MKKFVVIGNPIEHSLSPLLQSEYQETLSTVFTVAPELSLMFNDFIYSYSFSSSSEVAPAAVFDSYTNNSDSSASSPLFFEVQVWVFI